MKKFFTELIIFALVLTTPLSCTGDRCPDYRPDFTRSENIEAANAVVMTQQRIIPGRPLHSIFPPAFAKTVDRLPEFPDFNNPKQLLIASSLGRAPPQQHTASA